MKTYTNFTPHAINVYDEADNLVLTLQPTGWVLRVPFTAEKVMVDGIPVFNTTYSRVAVFNPIKDGKIDYTTEIQAIDPDLIKKIPDAKWPNFWIVSGMVKSCMKTQSWVMSPGEAKRDTTGKVVGYIGFNV